MRGEVPHLISGRPVELNGERCVLWEFRDVSVERQASEALQSAAARHHALLQSTVEGICIVDDSKTVLEVNERFAEMLGYTVSEMVGMHPWDWDLTFSESEVRARFPSSQMQSYTVESRHRRKDGSVYDAEVGSSTPISATAMLR